MPAQVSEGDLGKAPAELALAYSACCGTPCAISTELRRKAIFSTLEPPPPSKTKIVGSFNGLTFVATGRQELGSERRESALAP
jgi:hypothetical protein